MAVGRWLIVGTVHVHEPFADLFRRICERYPSVSAVHAMPQYQDGLSMAVMLRERVNPRYHFIVDDAEFREEARRILTAYDLRRSNEPDGVLAIVAIC